MRESKIVRFSEFFKSHVPWSAGDRPVSAAVREQIAREERQGELLANRVRYLFLLVLAVPIIWTASQSPYGLAFWINPASIFVYGLVTVAHSYILSRVARRARDLLAYAVLAADFLVVLVSILSWTRFVSPDNFAFALKNPSLVYMFIPLALTVLQFRRRLILTALGIYLLIFAGMLAFAAGARVQWTNDWRLYVNGPGVVFSNLFAAPAVFGCVALALWYATHRALRMARRIGMIEAQKSALSRYFAPQIVDEITDAAGDLDGFDAVRGRRQTVTVLFADVRGFTALSESLEPEELVTTLGELRQRQARVIFEHGGTLDKYIGDGVMASFGTPRVSKEPGRDARNAALCGRALLRAVADWNDERAAVGLPRLEVGVGLHAGEAFVGNVGFEGRLEYTVIGDVVNTAARVESLCKEFEWPYIISRSVADQLGDLVETEPLGAARVKGKAEPLECYRVLWAGS